MKKYISIVLIALIVAACDFGDTNVSPNAQTSTTKDALLAQSLAALGWNTGDDAGRIANIFTQHFAGGANQSLIISRYGLVETDINTSWANFYEEVMNETKNLKVLAQADGSDHYVGMANVITAMALGTATDLWGDIPYSEALKGSGNLKPAYDSQEAIYDTIQALLDRAIVQLGSTESAATPSAADFIYGGDTDLWIKAARVLKARYYNNLSEIDASGSAQDALDALNAGIFADESENFEFPFTTVATEQNPIHQFFNDRAGDIVMGEFFVDLMSGKSDPRLALFVAQDGAGGYSGSPAGSGEAEVSSIGPALGSGDSPMPLVTFAEAKFIEAEAQLRLGDNAAALTAYQDGIRSSMTKHGVASVDVDAYITANASAFGANPLSDVMEEKYVAMFTHPQPYTDFRRTGFPALSPAANNTNNNRIPSKFPYPQDERNYNEVNVDAVSNGDPTDINIAVYWDK